MVDGVEERLVPLDGPANFRDLGGYRTEDGRTVHRGRVFRSDSLSFMSDADVGHVLDVLGVRTVVDLRAGHEVDQFSHGPLEAHGVHFRHMPIVDETRGPIEPAGADAGPPRLLPLDEVYLLMLERFGDRFAGVLRVIADPGNHPVVFHCAAGKDRTGIVAALVLGLLGVPDDVIAADYALTADRMPVLVLRHRNRAALQEGAIEVGGEHFQADAAAMHGVLDELRTRFGGVEGYVRSVGIEPEVVAALRAGLTH